MRFHIDTALLFKEMKNGGECPLCNVEKKLHEQFLYEYLNDAVMDDDSRREVNELFFCEKHFDMLFSRPNKISLALQSSTRLDYLKTCVKAIKNKKQAKKQVEQLAKITASCVICNLVDESMERYFLGVEKHFFETPDFKKDFINSKGFCLKHYKKLLSFAKKDEYISALTKLEEDNFLRLKKELKWFCDKHDYRNANKPLGTSEDAIPRTGEKLYGKKQK